jgi:hypothetical protein
MQTDTYGDIPIKYYVKGAMPPEENVEYTSQESVYKDFIFPILDQANAVYRGMATFDEAQIETYVPLT